MRQSPTNEDFEGFRGVVVHETPGVQAGSIVEIEREGDGWHLYVRAAGTVERAARAWDVWCDEWSDAEYWFREWAVAWQRPPADALE